MDKDRLFRVQSSRKDDEADETFYDRIARIRRIQKAAAERVARRYADIKPKKQGRWRVGDPVDLKPEKPRVL